MKRPFYLLNLSILVCLTTTAVADKSNPGGKLLLEDSFDREESDPAKEEIGNGWGTNSRTRAKGQKQVDLDGGAMHITRAAVADHGVSVFHEVAFKDATIELRFKLGAKDDLGINIADMKEKSVHAGHICVARIRPKSVEITDLKTGPMKLAHRQARLENKLTPELKKLINGRKKKFAVDLATDEWHQLTVQISGDTMTVKIDDKQVGRFQSEGIGHPTKSRLRLSVNKSAWVDNVIIHGS